MSSHVFHFHRDDIFWSLHLPGPSLGLRFSFNLGDLSSNIKPGARNIMIFDSDVTFKQVKRVV